MSEDMELPAFAMHWARKLGEDPQRLEMLQGGINNRVFRCGDGKQKWVIKGYSGPLNGQRDRMQAELQFLHYASVVAPGFTPALIHADLDRRCVILENIEGEEFDEGIPPSAQAVETATRFINMLNRQTDVAKDFIKLDAADGFLSMSQHLANVEERIQAMHCEHLAKGEKQVAEQLIGQMSRKYNELKERTCKMIREGLIEDCINRDKRCISPSDFGFHNAIKTKSGIYFIDFEFAGWDDPAKATIDFILQPKVPVIGFGSPLLSAWHPKLQEGIKERCQYLEPILRLKWMCILLAVLNPERLMQIRVNTPMEKQDALIQTRLKNAAIGLSSLNN